MEKKKSKNSLLLKFADKFKKKKRNKSCSMSREKSSEASRGRRSPSRSKVRAQSSFQDKDKPVQEAKSKPEMVVEAKVKGPKREKGPRKAEDKKKEAQTAAPTRIISTIGLRRYESQMEVFTSKTTEKTLKVWVGLLEKVNFRKTLEEDFQPIDLMTVDMDKCRIFRKFINLCQSDNVELLDANRVKGSGEDDLFYHGSVVTISTNTLKTTILAQLALLDSPHSLESFWLMVAAHKIQRVFILSGEDELDKKAMSEYFPEDFREFKTIRVNNRKTVVKTEEQPNTQLYYEVVPKDCAEAPFAMIEICDFWPDGKIPTIGFGRIAATAASVFDCDIDADATCAIVSNYGAGRAGAFLVGALAIEKLRSGEPPNIKNIALTVRAQRPGAIETFPQYIFIYIIALSYGLKCVKDANLKARIEKLISQLEQYGCEKMTEEDEEDATGQD